MRRIKRTVSVVMVVRNAGSRRGAGRAAELWVRVDEELDRRQKRSARSETVARKR